MSDHEHHPTHAAHSGTGTEIDPVCGMTVDPASAAGSIDHAGKTYYFCSKHCVQKFRADPDKYLAPRAPEVFQLGASATPPQTAAGETEYVCPMHPEVRATHPAT